MVSNITISELEQSVEYFNTLLVDVNEIDILQASIMLSEKNIYDTHLHRAYESAKEQLSYYDPKQLKQLYLSGFPISDPVLESINPFTSKMGLEQLGEKTSLEVGYVHQAAKTCLSQKLLLEHREWIVQSEKNNTTTNIITKYDSMMTRREPILLSVKKSYNALKSSNISVAFENNALSIGETFNSSLEEEIRNLHLSFTKLRLLNELEPDFIRYQRFVTLHKIINRND